MGYFDDFSDPAMKELVESVGLIHEEVDEAREVPMNFHVKLLNRGINAKPGKKQGPLRGMAKFDIMHGDSDPSKGEPLERKRRGKFFDIHAPGSGERAGDKVRNQYSGGATAGQAASTSHLTGRPVGATPDQLAGLEKTRATIMKIGREIRGESVGDYGLGDLTEDPAGDLAQARSNLAGSSAGRDALKSFDNSREFAGKYMSAGSSVGASAGPTYGLSKPNTAPLATSSGNSGGGDSGRPTSSTSTRSGAPYVLNKGERPYVDPYDSRGETVAQANASYHRTADRLSNDLKADSGRFGGMGGGPASSDSGAKSGGYDWRAGAAGAMKDASSAMGMMKSMAGMAKSMSGSKSESVKDYGLGDLNETAKCAGCGQSFPCSDSKRTDISGRERAKHYVGPMAHERDTIDAGNKQGASSFGGAMAQAARERGLVPNASGIVSLGKIKESLDEGHGAIAHHYYYAQHGNGVNSASAGAQGSSDGGAQPTVGRRNEQMSRVEASWAAKRAADIYDIRNRHFAHGTVQEQTFRVGQVVESQTGIITTSGRLGVGAKGTVKSISEDRTVTVEFRAPIGEQKFAPDVMSAYFAPIKTESMRSIIRKAITEPPVTVEDHPSPGDRVVCENGFQYAVERRDAMGRMIQVTDHLGRSHMFNAGQIKKLPENTEFVRGVVGHQLSENLQSVPLNPGQKVTVATIDPIYNQWRVFPVYAGEAEGFLGATGMVEFAMYPVSSGTRMYRVLFEKGGRRDFSEAELTGAHEAGTVNPGI